MILRSKSTTDIKADIQKELTKSEGDDPSHKSTIHATHTVDTQLQCNIAEGISILVSTCSPILCPAHIAITDLGQVYPILLYECYISDELQKAHIRKYNIQVDNFSITYLFFSVFMFHA
jgi:hypothetical protein